MTLHRLVLIVATSIALGACQRAEEEAAVVPDRGAATSSAPASVQDAMAQSSGAMPEQEQVQGEADNIDPLAGFAWTLPESATTVDARANIYLAGQNVDPIDTPSLGVVPTAITLGDASSIRFDTLEGQVGCAGALSNGPDGGDCVSTATDISASNGYSAIRSSNRSMFIVGVFPVAPDAGIEVEAGLVPESDSSERVEPKPNQVFLIGDGKTADGKAQTFVKPDGATTLFVGFADAFGFIGAPDAYDDNVGRLRLAFTLDPK